MGTVMNGNVWSGACVNGKVVSGLAKNGVVFYKREIPTPSVYKRRIMIGDNLRNRTIYADFPIDYYKNLDKRNLDILGNEYIVCNNREANENIFPIFVEWIDDSKLLGDYNEYYSGGGGLTDVKYHKSPDTQVETIVNQGKVEDNADYIVTSILEDNESYRHVYIEDPNIRPLEIGDVITENTIFYFTFPDNLYDNKTIDWSSLIFDTTGSGGTIYMSTGNLGTDYMIYGYFASYSMTAIYQYNNGLRVNSSYVKCGSDGTGQVSNVHETLSKYVLVDTTTLG